MRTITMKFGGTSVGSVEAISSVCQIVRSAGQEGDRAAVVVSAMSGITDGLLESIRMAVRGDKWGYLSLSKKMRDRHEEVLSEMVEHGSDRESVLNAISKLFDQHIELCNAINSLGEATPRISDMIVSFGERLSARLVAAVLRQHSVSAKAFDAGQFLLTDDTYQNAQPVWDETQRRIESQLLPVLEAGVTPVITGFLGATTGGHPTTLGRGGSDYSAAIFAAYLRSDEFIVWTDVDGVMTTDPRLDKRARVLPYVSYQEVGELAFYGAKVLHPKTIQPILNLGIPVYVRNTFNPTHPGTRIGEEHQPFDGILKAVTCIRNVSMLTISGRGMLGVPGVAGRAFLATSRAGGNILMISQSSSEQSICFTVMDDKAEAVKSAVEEEFSSEIDRHNIEGVEIADSIVIITVVGGGMRGTPGVAGRVFTVMGEHHINVLAIAQGSSECSISFVISEADMKRAVIALHDLALEAVTI